MKIYGLVFMVFVPLAYD